MFESRADNRNSNTIWLLGSLILINVFWGASGVAVKEAYGQLGIIEVVTLRFVMATPLIIAATVLLKGRNSLAINIRDIPYMVVLATVGISASLFLQALSLDHTTVTNFTLISSLSTFAVILLSVTMIGEKPTKNKIIGAIVAFFGLALITINGQFEISPQFFGDGIALASAFFWGLYTVLGKKISAKYSALTVLSYVFLFASLEFLPFYIMSPHTSPLEFTRLTWASLGFLTICCTLIAFLVYNYSLEKLSASTVALTIYITPIAGVLFAAILLGERVTVYALIGSLFIVYGLYKAESKGKIDHDTACDR